MQNPNKDKEVTFLNFNQTNTCLLVGTRHGYSLFRTEPFDRCTQGFTDHPIHICEMFFSTSLLAVVCNSTQDHFTPKILYLYNTKIDQVICLLRFNEDIQGVKLNQQYLVVVLKQSIIIYTLEKIEPVCTLDMYFSQVSPSTKELANPRPSVVALCPNRPILAYPCDLTKGNVCLAKLNEPSVVSAAGKDASNGGNAESEAYGSYQILEAHDHAVVCLAFGKDGERLATASTRGTIIRVWDTNTKALVTELKRSKIGREAKIHSLCFSEDGSMLVVSSSSKTIHIFAIDGEKKNDRAFAYIRLDKENIDEKNHISSFSQDGQTIQVAFADGKFCLFRLPTASSANQNCTKISEYNLIEKKAS